MPISTSCIDAHADAHHGCMPLGPYLRDLRQRKGISLEAVAAEIKVSLSQLEKIEAETCDMFPDDIFVKGMLKSYARFIGIDETDVIDRYLICRRQGTPATPGPSPRESPKRILGRRASFLLQFFLILVVIAVLHVIYGASLRPSPPVEREWFADIPAHDAAHQPMDRMGKHVDVLLQLDATQKTRLEIIPDEREPLTLVLFPMDRVELAVARRVRLAIDNAGGVNIRLNDRDVSVPGKSGETIILDLP